MEKAGGERQKTRTCGWKEREQEWQGERERGREGEREANREGEIEGRG